MSVLSIVDATYVGVEPEERGAARYGVTVRDDRSAADPGEAADGVLVQNAQIGAAELDAHPSWRVVGRYGVGVDTIDLAAASERGIAVFNVPDYCVREVATHAAALTLASLRRIVPANDLVRAGGWTDWGSLRPVPDSSELRLGLIGLGSIGRETARLLAPFFAEVIGYDPTQPSTPGVRLTDLDTVIESSDVISLHCPLTAGTEHLIDEQRLHAMRPGVHLINVSRGGLVDSAALARALEDGHVGGAALDVLDAEPPGPDHPLLHAPRTTLTNHVAWLSESSEPRLRAMLSTRCASHLAGNPVVAPVNDQRATAPQESAP